MAIINVQPEKVLIGSFKDELIGGMSLLEFAKELESIDVNDAEALQAAAKRPKTKCSGNTITVNMLVTDPKKGGEKDSTQEIRFSFKLMSDNC